MNTAINFNGFIDPYLEEGSVKAANQKSANSNAHYIPPYSPYSPYDPTPDVEALRDVIRRLRAK